MKVKMCFYPNYVSVASAGGCSPLLFEYLEKEGVELEGKRWNGTIDGLPQHEFVIVRSSSKMHCSDVELAKRCEELGHLVYYDDRLLLPTGEYTSEALFEATAKFLEKLRSLSSAKKET